MEPASCTARAITSGAVHVVAFPMNEKMPKNSPSLPLGTMREANIARPKLNKAPTEMLAGVMIMKNAVTAPSPRNDMKARMQSTR